MYFVVAVQSALSLSGKGELALVKATDRLGVQG
jgi:hypothetical protein